MGEPDVAAYRMGGSTLGAAVFDRAGGVHTGALVLQLRQEARRRLHSTAWSARWLGRPPTIPYHARHDPERRGPSLCTTTRPHDLAIAQSLPCDADGHSESSRPGREGCRRLKYSRSRRFEWALLPCIFRLRAMALSNRRNRFKPLANACGFSTVVPSEHTAIVPTPTSTPMVGPSFTGGSSAPSSTQQQANQVPAVRLMVTSRMDPQNRNCSTIATMPARPVGCPGQAVPTHRAPPQRTLRLRGRTRSAFRQQRRRAQPATSGYQPQGQRRHPLGVGHRAQDGAGIHLRHLARPRSKSSRRLPSAARFPSTLNCYELLTTLPRPERRGYNRLRRPVQSKPGQSDNPGGPT